MQTGFPSSDLMSIWYAYLISFTAFAEPCRLLSDTRNHGQLSFPEFALAVYLCYCRLTGSALLLVLPEHLANEVSDLVDVIVQVLPLRRTSVHVMSIAELSIPQEANPLELGLQNPAAAKLIIFTRWSSNASEKDWRKAIEKHAQFKEVLVYQLLKWVPFDILDIYWENFPATIAVHLGPDATSFKKETASISSFLDNEPSGNEVVLCLGSLDSFSVNDNTWSNLLDFYEKSRGLRLVLLLGETVQQWNK